MGKQVWQEGACWGELFYHTHNLIGPHTKFNDVDTFIILILATNQVRKKLNKFPKIINQSRGANFEIKCMLP